MQGRGRAPRCCGQLTRHTEARQRGVGDKAQAFAGEVVDDSIADTSGGGVNQLACRVPGGHDGRAQIMMLQQDGLQHLDYAPTL